jgi:hypothetical protein
MNFQNFNDFFQLPTSSPNASMIASVSPYTSLTTVTPLKKLVEMTFEWTPRPLPTYLFPRLFSETEIIVSPLDFKIDSSPVAVKKSKRQNSKTKCRYCSRYAYPSDMIIHERQHTGTIKMHPSYCQVKSRFNVLIVHSRLHTHIHSQSMLKTRIKI